MKKEVSAPLVGMGFYPPALEVLQALGMDQPLLLQREPENPYDENAIKVLLKTAEFDGHEVMYILNEAGMGDKELFFLGFIARNVAETWAPIFDKAGEVPPAKLTFTSTGAPQVTLEIEVEVDDSDVEEEEE